MCVGVPSNLTQTAFASSRHPFESGWAASSSRHAIWHCKRTMLACRPCGCSLHVIWGAIHVPTTHTDKPPAQLCWTCAGPIPLHDCQVSMAPAAHCSHHHACRDL